jgi:hypothetical protein
MRAKEPTGQLTKPSPEEEMKRMARHGGQTVKYYCHARKCGYQKYQMNEEMKKQKSSRNEKEKKNAKIKIKTDSAPILTTRN